MAQDRSLRREVMNPLLTLPAFAALQELDAPTRAKIAAALGELRLDARARAEQSWRSHKAPMAAYWKAVSVYAGHTQRLLKQPQPETAS